MDDELTLRCLHAQVCNNLCDGIESVPYHKVFSFGGKKGMMQYMNTVEVMDCGLQVRAHDG